MNAKLLSLLFLWLFFLRNSTIDYKNILSVKGIKEPFIRVFNFFKSKISDAWYNHKAATIFTVAGVASASLGAVGYLQWRKKKREESEMAVPFDPRKAVGKKNLEYNHIEETKKYEIALTLFDIEYLKANNLIENIYHVENLNKRPVEEIILANMNRFFEPIKFKIEEKIQAEELHGKPFKQKIIEFKIKMLYEEPYKKEYKNFLAIILYMVGVSELLIMLEKTKANYENKEKFMFNYTKNNNKEKENPLIKKNEAANCFELFFHMIEVLQNKITEIVNLYDDKEIANEQLRTLIKLLKNNYIVNDGYTFNNLEIIFNTPRISFIEKIKENAHDSKYKELWKYLKSDIYSENIGVTYLTQIQETLQKNKTNNEFEVVLKMINGIKKIK